MRPFLFLAFAGALAAQQQGMNFYSIEKEVALGDSLAANFERNVTIIPDARVDRIGAVLVPKSSPFHYRIHVVDSTQTSGSENEPTTFPGGWIFVPRSQLARDDRQLAAILAHAIAHIELRHGTRVATKRELNQIGEIVAGIAMPEGQRPPAVPSGFLSLQRSFELAADRQAIQLLRNAGLDPTPLVEYLRTLPTVEQSRIDAAQKAIADLP
jgi:beta-barrel assembly-enhancing protease